LILQSTNQVRIAAVFVSLSRNHCSRSSARLRCDRAFGAEAVQRDGWRRQADRFKGL
jgi:hypothetical protein